MENKDNAKVNLMARAGSRTRKYQDRQTRQAPDLNYHVAMPATNTTHYASQFTNQTTFPVVATTPVPLPAAVASSSSQNRSSGNRRGKVCVGCDGAIDPNAPINSKEAFLYGDMYCGTCLLGFQRNG